MWNSTLVRNTEEVYEEHLSGIMWNSTVGRDNGAREDYSIFLRSSSPVRMKQRQDILPRLNIGIAKCRFCGFDFFDANLAEVLHHESICFRNPKNVAIRRARLLFLMGAVIAAAPLGGGWGVDDDDFDSDPDDMLSWPGSDTDMEERLLGVEAELRYRADVKTLQVQALEASVEASLGAMLELEILAELEALAKHKVVLELELEARAAEREQYLQGALNAAQEEAALYDLPELEDAVPELEERANGEGWMHRIWRFFSGNY